MANCILFPDSKKWHRTRCFARNTRGAALITAILVLLGVAFVALSVSGQQVVAHSQQINLDERRLIRQLATEQLFDDIAQTLEMHGRMSMQHQAGYVAHRFAEGGPKQRVLYSEITHADCPHDFPTLSGCWRIQIRQPGSGFIRERMLVIPKTSCAAAYWFPPEGRVINAPVMPPADAPPDYDDPLEPLPTPGGGLRP